MTGSVRFVWNKWRCKMEWRDFNKYPGKKLRKLRAERGVGRPPKTS